MRRNEVFRDSRRSSSGDSFTGRGQSHRAGFSLVEAMVSLTLLGLMGAVLLLGVESSLSSTTDAVEQTQAAASTHNSMAG